MLLREGEQILKIYRRHPTPFVSQIFFTLLGSLPFFLVIFLLKDNFDSKWFIIANMIVVVLFVLTVIYLSLIYWLDKLLITNERIVLVNWLTLTKKDEVEAFMHEIQEIQTCEKGFLSYFKMFDYGDIVIETASAKVDLDFHYAPDPEEIRRFIYHVKNQ